MRFCREITFRGSELALLTAMDRAGCVLGSGNRFSCILENEKLPWNVRLPMRLKGTCSQTEGGWLLRFCVVPALRTAFIGGVSLVFLVFSLITNTVAGLAVFGALCLAVTMAYYSQYRFCLRRFASQFARELEKQESL